jgi:hypothetical protein
VLTNEINDTEARKKMNAVLEDLGKAVRERRSGRTIAQAA